MVGRASNAKSINLRDASFECLDRELWRVSLNDIIEHVFDTSQQSSFQGVLYRAAPMIGSVYDCHSVVPSGAILAIATSDR